MALIIDYDEKTLRDHMEKRGLGMEIIDQKIKEFKQKTLPSAKYFDDQKLLHLVDFLKLFIILFFLRLREKETTKQSTRE